MNKDSFKILINEQLKIYGVEVKYLPRRIVNKDSIFTEYNHQNLVIILQSKHM